MKLTDFALIFAAIFLPITAIVYINTSFVVKAEKQEMYYKNIMNSAVNDAVSSMKQIENEDQDIDYGYSGIADNKVSINADVAVNAFYNSLANNFNIKDNIDSVYRLKMYIPVLAIMDYDGIYIHSAEVEDSGDVSFVTKPKVYYTYTYVLSKILSPITGAPTEYEIEPISNINSINLLNNCAYEITFTMDDYVYLNIYSISNGSLLKSTKFYLTDNNNNEDLVYQSGSGMLSTEKKNLKQDIINHLSKMRKQVIAEIAMKEISYAVNEHNTHARAAGINYRFTFSVESDSAWYETMDGIGMLAIIQGISLGNRYLNYKAYSASDLVMAKKYYLTKGITLEDRELAYFERDLYHISQNCEVYKEYINKIGVKLIPQYYTRKAEAATQGFYPCPICKP